MEIELTDQQTQPPRFQPVADPSRRLLTVDEVAAQLNVSRFTIWRMRDQGRFPAAIKIGSSARWRQADIDAFIAASRCEPSDSGIAKRRKSETKPAEQDKG